MVGRDGVLGRCRDLSRMTRVNQGNLGAAYEKRSASVVNVCEQNHKVGAEEGGYYPVLSVYVAGL